MKLKDRLDDLWKNNKDKIFISISTEIINRVGGFMFKKLWLWIWAFGKRELINLIKSQQDELETLIKKYADPKELAEKIIEWIVSKIEKI